MAAQSMAMPQNPNQAAGASMLPMSYAAPATALGATSPVATASTTGMTGPGASTAGQPFGAPAQNINTVGVSPTAINPVLNMGTGTQTVPGSGTGTGLPPTTPTNPTGFTPPSISTGVSTTDGSNTVVGDFSDTYGKGTGTALVNQLANLGTSTNTAVEATNAEIMQQAGIQEANMKAGQAAAGISPDSSSAALMEGDFASQVNTNLASIDANMELQGQQTLISSLQNEGQQHGPDQSGWDVFGDVLGAGASIAGDFVGAATGMNAAGGLAGMFSGGSAAASGISSGSSMFDMSSLIDW